MPNLLNKKTNNHIILLYMVSIVLLGFLYYFQWIIGIAMTILLVLAIYNSIKKEQKQKTETEEYITTLSYRVKKVGEEAVMEMPIGIVLYNEDYEIEWTNPFVNIFSSEDTLVGQSLNIISEDLIPSIKEEKESLLFHFNEEYFEAILKKDERLVYFFNKTEQVEIETLLKNEKTVLGIIFLDNYDEVTQGMDDTSRSQINSQMTALLNEWSREYNIYLKRTSQEHFLAILNQEILNNLEKTKFSILDKMKELQTEKNVPLTISIGIGKGENSSLRELGELAQSSLDLALGRGGDQVAIKSESGKVVFYGGKSNPMEKRTRVRARVISHALKELVKESDKVVIMGHKNPDMDSIGSAIGILKVAQANEKNGFIVYDPSGDNSGVTKLVNLIEKNNDLSTWFVDVESAMEIMTRNTLLVIVDTHKPSLLIEDRLLNKTEKVVVIDHHRRAEEFIKDPTLVYMEPYASSTAELVTELLEYQPKTLKLNMIESTALLAGIIVDTKYFTLRTGSRTFDAASYLRSKGADTVLVQKLLKEDLDVYIRRSKLIEKAKFYKDGIAIVTANPGEKYDPILIAQTADTLLSMNGVKASFVISEREDEKIGISARSLGEFNVQLIMEQMHGGGHLSNAATQLEGITIDEAETMLKECIDKYVEGRENE
jgi:cyclic-di-AMP phosphodiesterase